MTAAKRTREAAYDRNGYANVADKFVTCVQREGSFSITTEDCRNLLALISECATLREALRACITDEGAHCYQTGSVHALDCRIKGINAEARAALALSDGAR